ncbi:MAG: bifunctional glutamate N-acetyltransferase/amino-acid acetyltransferase ArgJ [Pseudomonadales bacterium]
MAVGPSDLVVLQPIDGLRVGVASAGIKQTERPDVVVFELAEGATTAGVFTKNAFCAAPVVIAKEHLALGQPSYLLVNTGNANAGTGEQGMSDAYACCDALAKLVDVERTQVLPFSTGVIGEPLPIEKIMPVLPQALENLAADNWLAAASGIMTTDTRPKGSSISFEHEGQRITLTGISKGSGMIKPNMATMLGYVATDAKIAQPLLETLVRNAADKSFNRITVDGDTSTNDACMLIATAASGVEVTEEDAALLSVFTQYLNGLMLEIAQQIVRDGEGATKLVEVVCESASTQQEALDVAYTVAHSPLVKTALFASDANWGRILAAVGRAGVENLDINKLQIFLDEVCIVERGGRAEDYTEEAGSAVMAQEEICIRIALNRGQVAETVWTTDLSHDYVSINADYRS